MTVVLMPKIKCASKNNFHTLDASDYTCLEEYVESMEFY